MAMTHETVLIIGAGMAGLCAALALSKTDRQITILERDADTPDSDPDETFQNWHRRGVSQLRQSHAFLARLRNIFREDHPKLLEELLDNGVRELQFENMLTARQEKQFSPLPSDDDLTLITSRRTTLELIMRRYVEELDNVTLETGYNVQSLQTEKLLDGDLKVTGVSATYDGGDKTLTADIVIDATGKDSRLMDQLESYGLQISDDKEEAGILYYTLHYRLRDGQEEPARHEHPPATGDLDYIKFGVFPGDNGCFSITLAVPEVETEMRKAILSPEVFHQLTLAIPGLEAWTNEIRSEVVGKVYGMGNLYSYWRQIAGDDKPVVQGYFPIGDTVIRTNPLYGRGCSFAAIEGQILKESLAASDNPKKRSSVFHEKVKQELRPFFDLMRNQDRQAIKRSQHILTPHYRPGFRARLMRSFIEDGIAIALRGNVRLLREALRGFHMLELPNAWIGRPRNLLVILTYWLKGKRFNKALYPPKLGPDRDELYTLLGVDAKADLIN